LFDEDELTVLRTFTEPFALQWTKINDRAKFAEHSKKSIGIFPPINHSAGHGSAFAAIFAINKKFQPCVVEKANCRRCPENIFLPVTRVSSDRDERQYFGVVLLVCDIASEQPFLDGCAPLLINSVRRVYVNFLKIPTLTKPIVFWELILNSRMND